MQYGKRFYAGKGCEGTHSGYHILEIEEDQPSTWCCHCAREFFLCHKCLRSLYHLGKINKCCKEMVITNEDS